MSQPDEEEVRRRLRLGGAQERATAARILGTRGRSADVEALRHARTRELDHYVLEAINQALESTEKPFAAAEAEGGDLNWEDESYQQAVREVSKMLVHELQDIVGFARLEIAAEVPDVENSRAASSIQRIADLLDAIELLGAIGVGLKLTEFDLSACVTTLVNREGERLDVEIKSAGPLSVTVIGSESLVDLVLTKALDNAVDSLTGASISGTVVIDWGRTDRDAWFSVMDNGPGLAAGVDAFGFGRTTKEGHLGVGLTIARRSMQALGGALILENNQRRGATLRANWPQDQP